MSSTLPNLTLLMRFLPLAYRVILTLTRRHGLFTLARLHHRIFPNGQTVRVRGGGRLFIPGDPHYFGFLTGVHEKHVQSAIRQWVRAGDTCVDIGANIGYFAMMMAVRTGPNGRVTAFEPVRRTFDSLLLNAKLAAEDSLKMDAIQAAVSDKAGRLAVEPGQHSTLHQVREVSPSEAAGVETVPAMTLDGFLAAEKISSSIGLVKVDVEGHELAVVQGMMETLRAGRVRCLILEITPGEEALEIERLLLDSGGNIQTSVNGRWEIQAIQDLSNRTDILVTFAAKL